MVRRIARVVLLDERDRVLLLRHTPPDAPAVWAPPGGGVKASEPFAAAARRELQEELALVVEPLVRGWWDDRLDPWSADGIERRRCFFLGRIASSEVSLALTDAARAEGITALRWWPLAALASPPERVFPPDLAVRIQAALARCR